MATFSRPVFSLNGTFIYVSATAWATSSAVHQISVATGVERFVIDGTMMSVIRTGRYRGYMLVGRHMYYGPPKLGSYNPVYVVRPDAKEKFQIPGSELDDGKDHVSLWLKANGWKAW